MTNSRHSVYFARVGDYVKIGFSANVPERLKSIRNGGVLRPDDLRTDIPVTLLGTIPGCQGREFDVQCSLYEWRVVGEWFEATDVVLDYIDGLLMGAAA